MGDTALRNQGDDEHDAFEQYLNARSGADTSDAGDDDEVAKFQQHLAGLSSSTTPAAPAAEAPPPERSLLERFLGGAREAASDAGDAIKPYTTLNGLAGTWGNVMNSSLLGGSGEQVHTPEIDQIQLDARAAHDRSPFSAGAASAIGTLPLTMTAGPTSGGLLAGGVDSAALGGSDRDQILHALIGAGVGAALHGAGAGIEGMANTTPKLEAAASRARVAATGMYGGAMKKLANEIGDDGITRLGNKIEEKGLHDAPGIAGWFPGSAERYHDNAVALADNALVRQRTAAFDADQAGVRVPTARTANELTPQIQEADSAFDPQGRNEAAFAKDLQGRMRSRSDVTSVHEPDMGFDENGNLYENAGQDANLGDYNVSFGKALKERQRLDQNIAWAKRNPGTNTPDEEETRRYVANQLRGELLTSLEDQEPHIAEPFRQAQDDLNTALTVQTPSAARVYQEAGNQRISLPTWIAGAGGIASGNPLTGAAMAAGASQIKARGQSAYAGMLRGGQRVGEAMQDPQAQMLSKFLQSPGAGVTAGGMAGGNPREVQQDAAADGNGSRLPGVINQMLQDPQRAQQLGRYRAEFENAGRSPGGISALLLKLENDREWRTNIKPQLMQLTAE